MKRFLAWMIPVGLLLALPVAWVAVERQEDVDYWGKIREYIERYNAASGRAASESAAEAGKAYLESLSAEELIIAGRQGTDWLAEHIPEFDLTHVTWKSYAWPMAWFAQQYPETTAGLSEIELLLNEVRNRDLSPYWRYYLIFLLSESWEGDKLLTNAQRREVSELLADLLDDGGEALPVRVGAAAGLPPLMEALKGELPPPQPREQREERLRRLKRWAGSYTSAATRAVSTPQTSPHLVREALKGLVRVYYLGLADTKPAVAAVGVAVRNYDTCPEELWPLLMISALELNVDADVHRLIEEASEEAEKDRIAERLQDAPRQAWLKIRSELRGRLRPAICSNVDADDPEGVFERHWPPLREAALGYRPPQAMQGRPPLMCRIRDSEHYHRIVAAGPRMMPSIVGQFRREEHPAARRLLEWAWKDVACMWPDISPGPYADTTMLEWWEGGQELVNKRFEELCAQENRRAIRDLGVAALPKIMERFREGDAGFIWLLENLTVRKADIPGRTGEERRDAWLEWWEREKHLWLVPFPDQRQSSAGAG